MRSLCTPPWQNSRETTSYNSAVVSPFGQATHNKIHAKSIQKAVRFPVSAEQLDARSVP